MDGQGEEASGQHFWSQGRGGERGRTAGGTAGGVAEGEGSGEGGTDGAGKGSEGRREGTILVVDESQDGEYPD
jgi:hypothetical protein